MKSNNTLDLMQVLYDLTELYEIVTLSDECRELENHIQIQVKGKSKDRPVLLPTLKRAHKIIDKIDPNGDIFVPIHDEFDDCVEYLDNNYSIKSKWLKTPELLRSDDYEKITDDLDRIIRTLIGYSENISLTPTIEKNQEKFSKKIVKNLDKKTRDDYDEALKCLDFGLNTASFMLLCRVAEKMAITYYEKFTKKNSKKNWNKMYEEIKEIQENQKRLQRPIIALFDFLRTKRNKAQHPGVRFDKKDCEKILHYLEDFQQEISKSKK